MHTLPEIGPWTAENGLDVADLHPARAAGAHQHEPTLEIEDLDAVRACFEKLGQNCLAIFSIAVRNR